jgi:Holliday junction resolvase RusA-like endonuclease
LVIPGDSNLLGANKRSHWRKEHKLKQQWKQNAFLIASLAWDGEPLQGMVRISYIIRRPRLLDPDNAMSSKALKAAVDGIVEAGLLRGDTVKLVTIGYVRQEKAKEPEVEIILEEITGE